MKDSFRALVIGRPGVGKTTFNKHILLRSRVSVVLADPLGFEYEPQHDPTFPGNRYPGVPERVVHLKRPRSSEILREVYEQEPPSLLVIDECHRFIGRGSTTENDPLMELLDIARNIGLHWILSTKHATLLPPHITTLSSVVMLNPPRTPAVQDWITRAGLYVDLNREMPKGRWLWAPESGQQEELDLDQCLSRAEAALAPPTGYKPRDSRPWYRKLAEWFDRHL